VPAHVCPVRGQTWLSARVSPIGRKLRAIAARNVPAVWGQLTKTAADVRAVRTKDSRLCHRGDSAEREGGGEN
jgi:hypothetical protein